MFRYQPTLYDCVPTTFVNALSHVFGDDFPPEVLKQIYAVCLDARDSRGRGGRNGTTQEGIFAFVRWLNDYKDPLDSDKKFRCDAQYLIGSQVHFRQNNQITRCLGNGGVVAFCVQTAPDAQHYILLFGSDRDNFYFFDSAADANTNKRLDQKMIEWDCGGREDWPKQTNLRIHKKYLNKTKGYYVAGTKNERECVLISKYK